MTKQKKEYQNGDLRTEWGHPWRWATDEASSLCGHTLMSHWRSTSGNVVRIFPPMPELKRNEWGVVVCDEDGSVSANPSNHHQFIGDDAEERAFCVAEAYIRQDRTGTTM